LPPLENQILEDIRIAKRDFGDKCPKKYAGASTVEILRSALQKNGFLVSERDVFIRGVPFEIDLLIPSSSAKPKNRILFEPSEVRIAFEIKNRGVFGASGVDAIRHSFARIKGADQNIVCIYLSLTEQAGYKWAVTTETLGLEGCEAFTLFWQNGSKKIVADKWEELIERLSSLTQS